MQAIRKFHGSGSWATGGKCSIAVSFDDGTTLKIGGKRAARAAAVVVYRAGDRTGIGTDFGEGWHIEGARQSVSSANALEKKIRACAEKWGSYFGRQLLAVEVLIVHDAEVVA